ncbi:hypothetical protein [Roseibium sp.]
MKLLLRRQASREVARTMARILIIKGHQTRPFPGGTLNAAA